MNSAEQIQAVEDNLKKLRKFVDAGESVERLRSNRDFKKVVLEGYFEQEAIRLVHLKGSPEMQTPDRQAGILAQIDSISAFQIYLNMKLNDGQMAKGKIAEDEQTLLELNQEELTND